MAKYVPTVEDMVANAANNYCKHEDRVLYYPRATIESNEESFKRMSERHGYVYRAIEDCSKDFVSRALSHYERNTDWSAFKRKDWQAAVDWNNAR